MSKNPKNLGKIEKNKRWSACEKLNRRNVTGEKWKKNSKRKSEEGSSGTNLDWSEKCRDAEKGIDSKNA